MAVCWLAVNLCFVSADITFSRYCMLVQGGGKLFKTRSQTNERFIYVIVVTLAYVFLQILCVSVSVHCIALCLVSISFLPTGRSPEGYTLQYFRTNAGLMRCVCVPTAHVAAAFSWGAITIAELPTVRPPGFVQRLRLCAW